MYGLRLFHGPAERFAPVEPFAAVTLLDVLEHVTDPQSFLAAVARFVAPGGTLVVVTPTSPAWRPASWAAAGGTTVPPTSIFFHRRSLERLLADHGFAVVRRRRFAWNFSAYYLATRLLPFLKGTPLQRPLKALHLRLQLFDSWEVYARKAEK